jgi:heat shock protein HslJ
MTSRMILFATFTAALSLPAQQKRTVGSWLDRSLVNWNRPGSVLPRLPDPPALAGEPEIMDACREQVRKAATAAEKAVVRKGWTLYGPVQSFNTTTVFRAMSAADGMCRPMGYQAFVYSEGRYAGTLSPVAMDSRSDGALTNIRIISASRISAEFARYSPSDPLCCPSRISTVFYTVRNDEVPDLVAANVMSVATGQRSGPVPDAGESEALLFGKRWALTEIGERKLSADKPYIEFNREERRVSGDSGCNRFSGAFQIKGASVKISQLIATRRACLNNDANRLEVNLLRLLEKTTRFEVDEQLLRLFADSAPVLVFAAR